MLFPEISPFPFAINMKPFAVFVAQPRVRFSSAFLRIFFFFFLSFYSFFLY